jgi:hypothetical protein
MNIEKLQLEAYRLSELSLSSELTASIAADQRAMTFCGLTLTAASILAGLYDSASQNSGLLLAALILVASSIFSAISARPVNFYAAGAKYSDFERDIKQDTDYYEAIAELAKFNDKHSASNIELMKRNSGWLSLSHLVAIVGVAVAVLSHLI